MKEFILDILFPVSCVFCHKEGEYLCEKCFGKIQLCTHQVCPYCERVFSPAGKFCQKCKTNFFQKSKPAPLDFLITSAPYDKLILSRLIHLFKYRFIEDLHIPLGKILTKALIENDAPLADLIIPVPLHLRRLRWRGFNQTELLARYISNNLTPGFSLPMHSDVLIRKKHTPPQMKIKNYRERQKNVSGIFSLNKKAANKHGLPASKIIQDKKILLIDDVSTTGATLFEAARTLKSAGAKSVIGAVLARQTLS